MALEELNRNAYVSILSSDGTIRGKADENTPGAVRRDWENKKDNTSGTKWEKVYKSITGVITNLYIKEGTYGAEIHVTIDNTILTIQLSSNFGTDFMRKLPNINILGAVTLAPYSFTPQGESKLKKGITVIQGADKEGKDVKLKDFFFNGKDSINGIPVPPKPRENMDNDDWKVFFIGVTKFLRQYTEDHMPTFEGQDKLPADPTADKLPDFNADEKKEEAKPEQTEAKV